MKRLVIGFFLGAALAGGTAYAAVQQSVMPPGSQVVVSAGTRATLLTFPGMDLRCNYARTLAPFKVEPTGTPMLFCSRASSPGAGDPNQQPQSHTMIVSPFRYYETDNKGFITSTTDRVP
jgi:hypothetical protein